MADTSLSPELYPPCQVACPVHIETQKLAEFVTRGEYEEALEMLLGVNPFSSVCGRICHHPCEQHCRRTKVDAPVGLMKLKRFIMDSTKEYRLKRRERLPERAMRSERIAIVGSGPSGMTAACDLAKQRFHVAVFEKEHAPGGLLGNVIPRYRLPASALKEDIEDILATGVELKTGVCVGKDITVDELINDGYSAILLATGLSESRTLNTPGIDSKGVLLALPFLHSAISPRPPVPGKRVIVIGGGNVAIDVARTSRRLGTENVTIICLESEGEMPAHPWEVEEAREEGISFMHSWGPNTIFTEAGEVKGIELKKCMQVFDETGRFSPLFDESDNAAVPVDTVIVAVGQRGDLTCIEGSDIKVQPGQRLEFDADTLTTSKPGVFACGEVVSGPGSSVESVRNGHRAAKTIAHYIETGKPYFVQSEKMAPLGELPDDMINKLRNLKPVATETLAPEIRVRGFSEIERGFTEAEAHAEARRCLSCTTGAHVDEEKCAACLTCVRICPFGVATVEKTAIMPEEKCQACGLCAAACPAAAIALKRFGTNRMKDHLSGLTKEIKRLPRPFIVSYCCLFLVNDRKFFLQERERYKQTGIYLILVPCVARLSVPDILSPFEMGADGLSIIECSHDGCLYPTAEERLSGRIDVAKNVLQEVGVEADRIDCISITGDPNEAWPEYWDAFRNKLISFEKQ